MRKRSTELLQRLLSSPEHILRGERLSEEYRLSEKTLRNDVQEILDFAREQGAHTLVKGVRGCTDFDWEFQMAQINRGLWPELDTILLPARTKHLHISSTMAREMIRYRQDLTGCIPAGALDAVLECAEGKVQ